MTTIWLAIVLGIIEGLTEFIPVSSTGHLIVAGHLLNFTDEAASTFEVFIQLGAILAVIVFYRRTFVSLAVFQKDGNESGQFAGLRGISILCIASLPALFLGAILHSSIKQYLFSVSTVAWALIIGGFVMLIIERLPLLVKTKEFEDISFSQALKIGLFQCFALWPGMSRSASTIIGGMICNLSKEAAAKFSFIIAVPIMFAAVGYDLLKNISLLTSDKLPWFGIGFLVSFIVALISIKFFLYALQKIGLWGFGIYRILLGIVILIFIN